MIVRFPRPTAVSILCAALFAACAESRADETLPLPLAGSAYRIAQQAYDEYARGDYDAAARDAREAVRLRPDVARLHTLLAQAEAARKARRVQPRVASGEATGRARPAAPGKTEPRRAVDLAARALDLLASGDVAGASRAAGDAVELAPGASSYRLLQIDLLLRLRDDAAASRVSRDALASAGAAASMIHLQHGYLLQRDGRYDEARADYDEALASVADLTDVVDDSHGAEQLRALRLLVARAELSAGDTAAALKVLEAFPDSDAEAQQWRRFAQWLATGDASARPALEPPLLHCEVNGTEPACSPIAPEKPARTLAEAAYRAAANAHPREALGLFDAALQVGGPDRELEGRRDAVRRQLAQEPAREAYAALADNDPQRAEKAIAEAIANAPDVMSYRLLLIDALTREQRYAEAEAAASAAIQVDDEDAVPLLLRGHLRQMQGHYRAARDDYTKAVKNDALGDDDLRNVRLYVADAALAEGDAAFASGALQPLPAGDAEAAWRRSLIAYYRHRADRPRLQAPFLDCRLTPYGTVCTARPADNAADAMVPVIFAALAKGDDATALTLARQLVAAAPKRDMYRRVLADALDTAGRHDEAKQARAALKDAAPELDYAYLLAVSGASSQAAQAFGALDAAGKLPATALRDVAFTAVNADQRPLAAGYFRRAIDAADAGALDLTPQSLYETRRAVSELERRWGAYVALTYRGSNNMQAGQNQSALVGDNLQIGAEAWWRPAALERNGTWVDLYARLIGTPYSAPTTSTDTVTGDSFTGTSPTGWPSLLSAFGVRWKPFASQNIVAAFERQQAIGSAAQSDWLARLGYSWGTGGDLRVDKPSWNNVQLYAETGYYLVANTRYLTSELDAGRSFRLPDTWLGHTMLTPHAVAAADYNNVYTRPWAVGAGVGLNLRTWLREDRYHAPRSYLDLSVQYRLRVAGDERAKGWFIRSVFNY